MQVFLAENFEKETLLNFARKRCKGKRCANLVRFSRQKTWYIFEKFFLTNKTLLN